MTRAQISKIIIGVTALIVIVLVYLSPLKEYLTLSSLKENSQTLQDAVTDNPLLSGFIYVLFYCIATALSFPGATVLSLAGGFLFGWFGVPLIVIGATSGAGFNFLLSRYVLGESLQKKYSKELTAFNQELEHSGWNYLLTLRLIPIFPFFLINILAGLTSLRFSTFIFTTALGIIPGVIAFTFAGTQISEINSTSVISPGLLLAFVCLGLVSLLPVIYKKIKSRTKQQVKQ